MFANDQAVKWAKAKVRVHADSVLCVGQVKDISGATDRWKGQVEDLKKCSSYQDGVGLDGELIEFEWTVFPGFSSLSLAREIQNDLETKNIKPEDFKVRDHLHVKVQRHCMEKMMIIASRMPKKSRITT